MVYQLHNNCFWNSASLSLGDESHTKAVEGNVSHLELVKQLPPHVALISLLKIWIITPLKTLLSPFGNLFLQFWIERCCPVAIPFAVEADGVVGKIDMFKKVNSCFRNANTLASSQFKRCMVKLSILLVFIQSFLYFCSYLFQFLIGNLLFGFGRIRFDAKFGCGVGLGESTVNCFPHCGSKKFHLFKSRVLYDLLTSPLHELKAQIPGHMDGVVNIVHIEEGQKQAVVVHPLLVGAGTDLVTNIDKIHPPVFEVSIVTDNASLFFHQLKSKLEHLGFVFRSWIINTYLRGFVDVFSNDSIFPSHPVVGRPFASVYRGHNSVSQGVTNQPVPGFSVTQCHMKFRQNQTFLNVTNPKLTLSNTPKHIGSPCGTTGGGRSLYCIGVYASVSHGVTDAMALVQRAFGFAETALQRALLGLWGSGWPLSDRWRPYFSFSCLSLELIGIGIKWARGFAACFGSGSLGSTWLQRRACA